MLIRFRPIWFSVLTVALCPGLVRAESPIELAPHIQPGDVTQVSLDLELGGQLHVRPEDGEKGTIGQPRELPMSVVGTLRYEERRLPSPADGATADASARGARYYEQADAVIKVDDGGQEPKLPDDRRLIVVQRDQQHTTLYCPEGPLTREQLDLIDVIGNSLLVEGLLPDKPVAEGDSWKQSGEVMAGLLTLDSVADCEVQSVLEQFNTDYAKVRLAGTVQGSVDGAATEMEVRAVYLFDRRRGQISRLNWAIRENRTIGGATPGLEGIAKLRVTLEPLEAPIHLTDEVVEALPPSDQPPSDDLVYEAPAQGFRIRHDSRWFVTGEERETVTIGRVDRTGLVAQCSITRLPSKLADNQTSLEQFQNDISHSLGESYGQLISSRQWTNRHGHHCLEVVVRGQVKDVPVEWHYFLVAPDGDGHRATVVVTVEGEMVERLAHADRDLVNSLELIPVEHPAAETPTPATAAREAPAGQNPLQK